MEQHLSGQGVVPIATGDNAVDLNSDLGEGFGVWSLGDDEALLGIVTSANVACGFHAGDPSIMRATCARAAEAGVTIGAQVSYRDLAGFGRRAMAVPPDQLADEVTYQIGALDGFARAAGSGVSYVKPHGALYNTAAVDPTVADAVVSGMRQFSDTVPMLGLAGSALLDAAHRAGMPAIPEAFADRAYTPDGHLVPRGQPGSVLREAPTIASRCVDMALNGYVTAVDGQRVTVTARSICVHGDTPDAVSIARAVRAALRAAGIRVAAFADAG